MKKLLVALLALAMVFAFTACDDTNNGVKQNITLSDENYFSDETIKFANEDGVSISSDDGYNYKVSGILAKMTSDQASQFGLSENSSYLGLHIDETRKGATVVRGWVATLDSTEYQDTRETAEITDEGWGIVLAITDGETLRYENAPIWKAVVTVGDKSTTYSVDFTDQIKAIKDAASTGSEE